MAKTDALFQHPLRALQVKQIEETIASAITDLTGQRYTAAIDQITFESGVSGKAEVRLRLEKYIDFSSFFSEKATGDIKQES